MKKKYKYNKKQKTLIIITVSLILIISFYALLKISTKLSNTFFYRDTDTPEVYDIVLFWGQSNMVGYSNQYYKENSTAEFAMPNNFDRTNINSVYEYSQKSGIAVDILSNTYSTYQVKTPLKNNTAFIYKTLNNNLEMITSETTKFGDGDHGLSYVDGNLVDNYFDSTKNTANYISVENMGAVNMIPEFCRKYYEATGHGVIAVNGGVGGAAIQEFLRSTNSAHISQDGRNYLYEGMILNFKNALSKAKSQNLNIGDSYWVSFQGEANVYDDTSSQSKQMNKVLYEQYYNEVVNQLNDDLKLSDSDTVQGALVETAFTIGEATAALGVRQIHNSQENIINSNSNIVLGSSFAYDKYIPDVTTFYNNNTDYNQKVGDYININPFKTKDGIVVEYYYAVAQASSIVCENQWNKIHFNSAALSQIGREAAESIVDNFYNIPTVDESNYNDAIITEDNAYYSNLDLHNINSGNGEYGDPFLISETTNGIKWYYLFTTDNSAYKSQDLKNWSYIGTYIDSNMDGKDHYIWAPEVYKINNKYYLFYSAVYWGTGYPYGDGKINNSTGSVYVATIDSLSNLSNTNRFKYKDNMYDAVLNKAQFYEATGGINNRNIDGTILEDDGKYYYYFKSDANQEIYGLEIQFNSNDTITGIPSTLTKIVSRDEDENIDEGPYVVKNNGKYYLMYSIGSYTDSTYRLRTATSSNPLTGFNKTSNPNGTKTEFLYGSNPYTILFNDSNGNWHNTDYYDSNNFLYGTGHNAVYKDSTNELYTIYHTAVFGDYTTITCPSDTCINKYINRKINIDELGFTQDGTMYVNGPTTEYQPLPSGTTYANQTYYKLTNDKYNVSSLMQTYALTDGVKSSTKNVVPDTLTLTSLTVTFNNRMDASDIWIYGDNSEEGLKNANIKVIINNKYAYDVYDIGNGNTYKVQLPILNEKIKQVSIYFDKTVTLSEVEAVATSLNEYQETYNITYDLDGGTDPGNPKTYKVDGTTSLKRPTKNGYDFIGWTGTGLSEKTMDVQISVGNIGDKSYKANWKESNSTKYTVIHQQEQLDGTYQTSETKEDYGKTNSSVTPETKSYIGFKSPEKESLIINPDGNATLTYKYKRKTHTVKVTTSNGIKEVSGANTYKYGQAVTIECKLYEGYEFNEWSGSNTFDTQKYTFEMPDKDVEYKATASLIVYSISYDLDGGSDPGNKTSYNVETSNITISQPTKNGYTFKGWTGTDLSSTVSNLVILKGSIGNRSYKAMWEEKSTTPEQKPTDNNNNNNNSNNDSGVNTSDPSISAGENVVPDDKTNNNESNNTTDNTNDTTNNDKTEEKDTSLVKSVTIKNIEFDFDKTKKEYDIEVDSDIDSITIDATLVNNSVKFDSTLKPRTVKLKFGKNVIRLKAIGTDNLEDTYTFNITRKGLDKNSLAIETLSVNGVKVKLTSGIYDYNVNVKNTETKLNISIKLEDSSSSYEISGNEELVEGENEVLVEITDKDKNRLTYTLNVIKEKKTTNNKMVYVYIGIGAFVLITLITSIMLYTRNRNKKLGYK